MSKKIVFGLLGLSGLAGYLYYSNKESNKLNGYLGKAPQPGINTDNIVDAGFSLVKMNPAVKPLASHLTKKALGEILQNPDGFYNLKDVTPK